MLGIFQVVLPEATLAAGVADADGATAGSEAVTAGDGATFAGWDPQAISVEAARTADRQHETLRI
jgi:hypothetical protein